MLLTLPHRDDEPCGDGQNAEDQTDKSHITEPTNVRCKIPSPPPLLNLTGLIIPPACSKAEVQKPPQR